VLFGKVMSRSKLRDRSVLVVAFLLTLAAILIGCGGGGGSSSGAPTGSGTGTGTGSSTGGSTGSTPTAISFTLNWPTATRAIPSYAKSLVLRVVENASNLTQTRTINRGSSLPYTQVVTFTGLNPGSYTVSGDAYLDPNATGPLLATFTAGITVGAGSTVSAPISFSSTIAEVVIDGIPVLMETGVTTQLSGHAIDDNDDLLLLPIGCLQWSIIQGADLVELTAAGYISAIAPGTVTLRLTDSASGKFDEGTFDINGDPLTTTTTTGTTGTTTGTTDATTTGTTTGGDTTTGTTDTTGTTGTTGTTDTGGTTATGTAGGTTAQTNTDGIG
jgi:hypothetical protein